MEIQNQKEVWNNIAQEWHEFKQIPAKHVKEFLDNQTGNILDLGSGSGRMLQKIKNGKMFLVDFSDKMLKLAKEKAIKGKIEIEIEKSNLWEIPYKDNFFNAIICISALHCIKEEEKRIAAIKEIYRVLKPNSQAIIGVWNARSKRFKNKSKEKLIAWRNKGKRYYYLYYEEEIHKQFKDAGFKIIKTLNSEMMINFIVEK
jgi:ubiquinone/menaquinone biosynthesis C-methylase UbiE